MATHEKRGNSYKITVSLGYDLNEKQIRKRMTWTPPLGMTLKQEEKELERQKILFEERCRSGQVLDGNIRFAEFADIWFEKYAEKQLKSKTVSRYKELMKRILPALGHIRLDKLQPLHLQEFYDNLAESGIREDATYKSAVDFRALLKERKVFKKDFAVAAGVSITTLSAVNQGKNIRVESANKIANTMNLPVEKIFVPVEGKDYLSPKTIQHHHRLISTILNTAVQWQVVFSNPCDRVKPPKIGRKQARYLDDVETIHLLKLLDAEKSQYRVLCSLLLYTGFRRGEACGLEWEDIDFENNIIHIRRESLYLPEQGIFVEDGKSDSSIRSIKVPEIAMALLKEHKIWQAQERLKLGDRWEDSGRLFTNKNGGPIHPDNVTGWFHRFVETHNLPSISIHSLRHTNATLMIASGVPITTVAKRLGHANATVTGTVYAHAIRTADEIAADTIGDILQRKGTTQEAQ